jgi:small multidrug resistance pump
VPSLSYLYLAGAIIAEVIATTFLKASDGFTKLGPSLATAAGYAFAFYCLSIALRTMSTGVAYAIWCGAGIVLIALLAWIFHGERLDLPAVLGMGLVIAGVVVMSVFSKSAAH